MTVRRHVSPRPNGPAPQVVFIPPTIPATPAEVTPDVLDQLADDIDRRFRSGVVTPDEARRRLLGDAAPRIARRRD